jgi:hypothetical protein
MDINKPIEVASNSQFLLIASPIQDSYMYGAYVTTVKKNDEIHFILQQSDGSNDETLSKGYESAVCLQILRAFEDDVVGKKITDVHFYAWYDASWHHVYFNTIDVDKIKKTWPECDSGEALGIPVVEKINAKGRIKIPVADDFSEDAFFYWWHTVNAIDRVWEEYENELRKHLCELDVVVPFGDISYEAAEIYTYKGVFAKSKKIISERLNSICEENRVIYQTPLKRVKDRRGWVSIVVYFDNLEVHYNISEPGSYELDEYDFESFKQILSDAGGLVKIISDDSWSVILSTEIDLSKITGLCRLFRRGEYHFTLFKYNSNSGITYKNIPNQKIRTAQAFYNFM